MIVFLRKRYLRIWEKCCNGASTPSLYRGTVERLNIITSKIMRLPFLLCTIAVTISVVFWTYGTSPGCSAVAENWHISGNLLFLKIFCDWIPYCDQWTRPTAFHRGFPVFTFYFASATGTNLRIKTLKNNCFRGHVSTMSPPYLGKNHPLCPIRTVRKILARRRPQLNNALFSCYKGAAVKLLSPIASRFYFNKPPGPRPLARLPAHSVSLVWCHVRRHIVFPRCLKTSGEVAGRCLPALHSAYSPPSNNFGSWRSSCHIQIQFQMGCVIPPFCLSSHLCFWGLGPWSLCRHLFWRFPSHMIIEGIATF